MYPSRSQADRLGYGRIDSWCQVPGEFEERLKAVLKEVTDSGGLFLH